jgi:predicted class III extradiol MEMO1 family dioxygenase
MLRPFLQQPYKGYTISGSADPVHDRQSRWFATGRVLLMGPNHSCLEVQRLQHKLLTYKDEDLATWFGFGLAEIAVDEALAPPAYYLRPMDVGWARRYHQARGRGM